MLCGFSFDAQYVLHGNRTQGVEGSGKDGDHVVVSPDQEFLGSLARNTNPPGFIFVLALTSMQIYTFLSVLALR